MTQNTSSPTEPTVWINGADHGAGLERRTVFSPADGREVGTYAVGTAAEAQAAVAAASAARKAWAATTAFERAEILERIGALLSERRSSIEAILTAEQGKPLATESVWELDEAIAHFTVTAEAVRRLDGLMPPSADPQKRNLVYRVPRGVVAAIQPWNFPVAIACSQLAPALGGGNTVIMLPAPSTTLAAYELARVFIDAGLPDGVFNFVAGNGAEVGNALTSDPGVDLVAFTGSTATGARVASSAAGKANVLELGGNGPITILEDADIPLAIEGVMGSAFLCAGQACTAAELVLVHEDVYDEFAAALVEATSSSVVLGEPTDDATTMGPMHNEDTAAKMDRHVADAVERGATVLLGGARDTDRPSKLYWPATILGDVTQDMQVSQEETFGPILPLRKIRSEEEALAVIAESPYGLATAVYTRDLARGLRFAEAADAGMVNVNEMSIWTELHLPFGGRSGKGSGTGRLQGRFALEDTFTELKTIVLHLG